MRTFPRVFNLCNSLLGQSQLHSVQWRVENNFKMLSVACHYDRRARLQDRMAVWLGCPAKVNPPQGLYCGTAAQFEWRAVIAECQAKFCDDIQEDNNKCTLSLHRKTPHLTSHLLLRYAHFHLNWHKSLPVLRFVPLLCKSQWPVTFVLSTDRNRADGEILDRFEAFWIYFFNITTHEWELIVLRTNKKDWNNTLCFSQHILNKTALITLVQHCVSMSRFLCRVPALSSAAAAAGKNRSPAYLLLRITVWQGRCKHAAKKKLKPVGSAPSAVMETH